MFDMKEYKRKRRQEHRAIAIEVLGGVCVKCGENDPELLEFDHIDPRVKSFNIGQQLTRSINSILLELRKCQLLCVECHKEKTYNEQRRDIHGTTVMYGNYGCRCDDCRKAYSEYSKASYRRSYRYKGVKDNG